MKRMGFLGPQGTHSEAAALYLQSRLPGPVELQAFPDIYAAMQAVAAGRIDGFVHEEPVLAWESQAVGGVALAPLRFALSISSRTRAFAASACGSFAA